MTAGDVVTYAPREASRFRPPSSWWVSGSRDRYGFALFVSERGDEWIVWENRRPYGINRQLAILSSRPVTWDDLDAAVRSA